MSAVTSKLNQISIGEGKNKKTIFTGTTMTPTTDADGNKTYKVEIVQYDNANGDGGRVIGQRDETNGSKINWNDNANKDITGSPDAQKSIKSASKTQANSLEPQLVGNSADSQAFNKAQGISFGTESDNDQSMPTNAYEAKETFQNSGCLLYTSPSPRDATLSRMPSSA